MLSAIADCLKAPVAVPETTSFEAWTKQWFNAVRQAPAPIDLAIRMASQADRMAWVFASAYQAALRALVPDAPADELLSLCVTEDAGNWPRDIQTRIDPLPDGGWQVHGCKRWAMLGPVPTTLLVVGASAIKTAQDTPNLRVVKVAGGSTGLSIQHVHNTRFIPEAPHCAVDLNHVRLRPQALLPGDGYLDYMKPFRTLEDIYVTAATLVYLLREARANRWPQEYMERAAAALASLNAIAALAPTAPVTHVLLAGALQMADGLRAEATAFWQDANDVTAERWRRDAPLFEMANTVRSMRRKRAWERLGAAQASAADTYSAC